MNEELVTVIAEVLARTLRDDEDPDGWEKAIARTIIKEVDSSGLMFGMSKSKSQLRYKIRRLAQQRDELKAQCCQCLRAAAMSDAEEVGTSYC